MEHEWDVVVVGGGAAGLSGAIALARSRRSVLVLDAGAPRNAPADAVHNLLANEGISPSELLARGRADLRGYGGDVREAVAVSAEPAGDGFVVRLGDGGQVSARRLLVTTGLLDELPEVPGVRERWGHQVLHCPYCHGWEVRDQRIGVLATSPAAMHQAMLFSQLSDAVVVLTHLAPPSEEDRRRLTALGVRTVEGVVTGLEGPAGSLTGVRLEDGAFVELDAVVVAPRMVAASAVLDSLGLLAEDHPSGLGQQYPSEPMGRTSVSGVWVAGNVADIGAQVQGAAAAGTMAGAAINADLIQTDLAAGAAPAYSETEE